MSKEYCAFCQTTGVCRLEETVTQLVAKGVPVVKVRQAIANPMYYSCPSSREIYQNPYALDRRKTENAKQDRRYLPSPSLRQNLPPDSIRPMFDAVLSELVAFQNQGGEVTDGYIRERIEWHADNNTTIPISPPDVLSLYHYEKVGMQLVAEGRYSPYQPIDEPEEPLIDPGELEETDE